jgi:hypothetical protein
VRAAFLLALLAAPSLAQAAGAHWRIDTDEGPVHVFRPDNYDRRTGGVIVYVHGLYTSVDDAWRDHRLQEQFAASRQNALFIAPEAPVSTEQPPLFADLSALVRTALDGAGLRRPPGPLVAVGHSGAFRMLVRWLGEPALTHVILVDALYDYEPQFRAWLDADPAHKLTLVVRTTASHAETLMQNAPYAHVVQRVPETIEQLTQEQRAARLLCLYSQFGHMELITSGQALPVLLRRAPLRLVRAPK